jgi:hypothetical protein
MKNKTDRRADLPKKKKEQSMQIIIDMFYSYRYKQKTRGREEDFVLTRKINFGGKTFEKKKYAYKVKFVFFCFFFFLIFFFSQGQYIF